MDQSFKFWHIIEQALLVRDVPIYYAGGTLCIDARDSFGVGINLSGKGFVYHGSEKRPHMKNSKVYVPAHIQDLARKIYLETKGPTEHYKRELCKS